MAILSILFNAWKRVVTRRVTEKGFNRLHWISGRPIGFRAGKEVFFPKKAQRTKRKLWARGSQSREDSAEEDAGMTETAGCKIATPATSTTMHENTGTVWNANRPAERAKLKAMPHDECVRRVQL